jgi:hypothetical protein
MKQSNKISQLTPDGAAELTRWPHCFPQKPFIKGRFMNLVKFVAISVLLTLSTAYAKPPQEVINNFDNLAPEQIERELQGAHPAAYILYAGKLWSAGRKDQSIFWLYVGQLRYRFYLLAKPQDLSGDPALFASLMNVVGEPINVYAGGHPQKWIHQMDAALLWDEQNPNSFTSKSEYATQLSETRSGLIKLRDYVSSNQKALKDEREQNGIGQVGMIDGVYVEEREERMPKDWPPLASRSTLVAIQGTYLASFDALLGPTLFFSDQHKVIKAKTFELSAIDNTSLLVVARSRDTELLRRTIPVREEGGAIVFEEQRTAAQAGLSEGGVKETVLLRINTNSDLVIQRDSLTEGKRANKPTPIKLSYTFWNRARRADSK